MQAAACANDVEQIAMIPGGGVGPFTGRAFAALRSMQPDEERATGRVVNVADHPIPSLAPAIGQVMATHRLGLCGQAPSQPRDGLRHVVS